MTPPDFSKDFPVFRLDDDADPGWERISTQNLLNSPFIQIQEVKYRTPGKPDGSLSWTVARRKNAVIVAPRLADGSFLLIHQERYPIQRTIWEFPAGQIDHRELSDDPATILATARRELEEEAGYRLHPESGSLLPLGYFFSSQGFTDEHAYLFLAEGLEKIPDHTLGEADETIHEARAFTPDQLSAMIADNQIVDANTLALFARMKARGIL